MRNYRSRATLFGLPLIDVAIGGGAGSPPRVVARGWIAVGDVALGGSATAEAVRLLVNAGADTTMRGTGAPGFHDRTASDLAAAAGRPDLEELFR